MIIIADSGSTKTDWRVITKDKILAITTMGFNPFFHTEMVILNALQHSDFNKISVDKVQNIYYYGAGCSAPHRNDIVKKGLKSFFNNANIEVNHDLLASARAICGRNAGIACILGTGSNSCEYNGTDITKNIISLGYMLGDDGSGAHLGKELIRAYCYEELPERLDKAFFERYQISKKDMVTKIYKETYPNVFFASFSKFLGDYKSHPFVQKLVRNCFEVFFKHHVSKYPTHQTQPIGFVGSIAFHFKDILEDIIKYKGWTTGQFIQKPIDALVEYHR